MPSKCIVINLFGVPSAGKSTGAAYIFSQLKMAGVNAELVTEFATVELKNAGPINGKLTRIYFPLNIKRMRLTSRKRLTQTFLGAVAADANKYKEELLWKTK